MSVVSGESEPTRLNYSFRCWLGGRLEPLVNEEDMRVQNWFPAWLEESQQFPEEKGLEDKIRSSEGRRRAVVEELSRFEAAKSAVRCLGSVATREKTGRARRRRRR
eukprot:2146061-Pleurochrysis_carterae.AAC.2